MSGLEARDLLTAAPLWSPGATRAAIVARLSAVPGVGSSGDGFMISLGAGSRPGALGSSAATVIGKIPDIESDMNAQQLRLSLTSHSTLPPLPAAKLRLNQPQAGHGSNRPI